MNHARIIRSARDHATMTWLLKEVRRGRFSEVYPHIWRNTGLSKDELRAVGSEEEAIRRMSDGVAQTMRIANLAMSIAWARPGGKPEDARHPPTLHQQRLFRDSRRYKLIAYLHALSFRPGGVSGFPNRRSALIIGYLIGAAEYALASGISFRSETLIETVFAIVRANGLAIEIDDVREVLRDITYFGPVTDWILWEEVERLKPRMQSRLVEELRSPRACTFLREFLRLPGAGDWLIGRLSTAEEQALLRDRLMQMRSADLDNR